MQSHLDPFSPECFHLILFPPLTRTGSHLFSLSLVYTCIHFHFHLFTHAFTFSQLFTTFAGLKYLLLQEGRSNWGKAEEHGNLIRYAKHDSHFHFLSLSLDCHNHSCNMEGAAATDNWGATEEHGAAFETTCKTWDGGEWIGKELRRHANISHLEHLLSGWLENQEKLCNFIKKKLT